MAMTVVEQNGGQYHVLVIIADGQVCYLDTWLIFITTVANVKKTCSCEVECNQGQE